MSYGTVGLPASVTSGNAELIENQQVFENKEVGEPPEAKPL